MTEAETLAYLNGLGSRPWSRENHCLAVVREIRRTLFGRDDVPLIAGDLIAHPEQRQEAFATHPARADWIEVTEPQHGDVAIMTKPHDLHAGIYLTTGGRGLVWHSDIAHGLVADTVLQVTQLRRWTLRFFRPRS